jgi:hypothetical protein
MRSSAWFFINRGDNEKFRNSSKDLEAFDALEAIFKSLYGDDENVWRKFLEKK